MRKEQRILLYRHSYDTAKDTGVRKDPGAGIFCCYFREQ